MNINSIHSPVSGSAPTGTGKGMDAESRNIQKQIEDARKKLQEISANGEINPEEKMKKRQEIQKQISDLQIQLRQHQADVRRQQQEEARISRENASAGKQKAEETKTGVSAAGMESMISADSSVKQAKVQNGVAAKMEGRAGVLEAEIKQDKNNGGNTERKEAELAQVNQRASDAAASGMKTLKEANRKIEEGVKAGQTGKEEETAAAEKTENEDDKAEKVEGENTSGKIEEKEPGMYVDVRL